MAEFNKNSAEASATQSRRRFIQAAGAAGTFITLAGCTGNGDDDAAPADDTEPADDADGPQQEDLTVGAAPSGSTMYNTWQGILRATEERDSFVNLTVQETPGGEANLRLYEEGQIDIGGGSLHDINQVMNREGPFAENPVNKLVLQAYRYAVMYLYGLAVDGSGIETYDDLRDANVVTWPIAPGTSVRAFTGYLWEQPEIDLWDDIDRSDISPDDIAGAVEEGRVDAIIVYNSGEVFLPDYYQQIDARSDLYSIEMGDDMKSAMNDMGVLTENFEPFGFEQDLDPVDAWTLDFQVGFGDTVSHEAGYELTMIAAEETDIIQDAQAAFPSSPEEMSEAVIADEGLPVHPGVAEAYEELGVFDDSWTVGWETDF